MYSKDLVENYLGWFNDASDIIAHDPGLGIGCPFCDVPLAENDTVSTSLMPVGGTRSYFYRLHRKCRETLGDVLPQVIKLFEDRAIDAHDVF